MNKPRHAGVHRLGRCLRVLRKHKGVCDQFNLPSYLRAERIMTAAVGMSSSTDPCDTPLSPFVCPLFVLEERSDNGKDERKETKGWVVAAPLLLLSIPFLLARMLHPYTENVVPFALFSCYFSFPFPFSLPLRPFGQKLQ